MRPKKMSYKRKKSSKSGGQSNSKYRKINVSTCDSNNNSDSCLMSRHEMLVEMIQQSREDSQQISNSDEVFSVPSTSTDDVKSKYIQQLQEDMNEIDVVDIRKRKLVRMWMQKQNLESKIDDKLQEREILNQEDTRSVELSLAMTAAKVQEMEKHRRSQLDKLIAQLKEYRDNNWELMYMLYQSQEENEDLKIRLRNLYKRQKNQRSSEYSWKKKKLAFKEQKTEAIVNCTLILICAYILYHLAVDVIQRVNPSQMMIEEIEVSSTESQKTEEILKK
ncbi:uncharacterized protein LOC117169216 isoform X2 [Belonocnema kinseyi]|uniref:uncharacterized protein LOC117169216 isoform X2 n=1 Tax=Belonocnema kinseyi TaxID=2817044 RepID=UPI00143D0F91|nr:uncharacterized protein LOC117169216 isoform X2 [Belonocnema kinseyi]